MICAPQSFQRSVWHLLASSNDTSSTNPSFSVLRLRQRSKDVHHGECQWVTCQKYLYSASVIHRHFVPGAFAAVNYSQVYVICHMCHMQPVILPSYPVRHTSHLGLLPVTDNETDIPAVSVVTQGSLSVVLRRWELLCSRICFCRSCS